MLSVTKQDTCLIKKKVINMKPYGIGLIVLLISFAIGAYTTYVSYNYLMNPPNYQNPDEVTARTNELKTATLLGLISTFMGMAGILIFLVEFMKHEHTVPSTKVSSSPP